MKPTDKGAQMCIEKEERIKNGAPTFMGCTEQRQSISIIVTIPKFLSQVITFPRTSDFISSYLVHISSGYIIDISNVTCPHHFPKIYCSQNLSHISKLVPHFPVA